MAIFCLTRKTFTDRLMSPDELEAFAEFLRAGYVLGAKTAAGQGRLWCEAVIYAFPRYQRAEIRAALEHDTDLLFDDTDPDELRISTAAQRATEPANIFLWERILLQPECRNTCLRFRLCIDGPVNGGRVVRPIDLRGKNSFVLCGAPDKGCLLLKALWPLGGKSEVLQQVFRAAKWNEEDQLLRAFDSYLQQCAAGEPERGAREAWTRLSPSVRFLSSDSERQNLSGLRQWSELPDDRGPLGFLRRLAFSLFLFLIALPVLIFRWSDPLHRLLSILVAAWAIFSGGRILWKKLAQIRRYRTAMRKALDAIHNGAVNYQAVDLSEDETPTLLKCSAEAEELGASHVCDISISTPRLQLDANRVYVLDDARITVGLLRKTENLLFFPPRPIILIKTRFADGRSHNTVNRPLYRKNVNPNFTSRCLLNDGSLAEALALHRRIVDRLKARGASLRPAPSTTPAVLAALREEADESREAWKKRPYSWSDALHESFKICRREHLRA